MCDCGAIHDRDLNAARNIKNFGIEQYRRNYGNSDACGENGDSASSLKQEAKYL
jgi:transposase